MVLCRPEECEFPCLELVKGILSCFFYLDYIVGPAAKRAIPEVGQKQDRINAIDQEKLSKEDRIS